MFQKKNLTQIQICKSWAFWPKEMIVLATFNSQQWPGQNRQQEQRSMNNENERTKNVYLVINFTLPALEWERGVMENLFTHQGLVTRKKCWCGTVSIPSPAASYIRKTISKQRSKITRVKNWQESDGRFSQDRLGGYCVCVSLPHPWYKSQ